MEPIQAPVHLADPIPANDPIPQSPAVNHDSDAESLPALPPQLPQIAGFWRRLCAAIIDLTIFALPLLLLGFAFGDLAFQWGPWGRLVGYLPLILYWGVRSAGRSAGQTIGKRLLGIAVVDAHGNDLTTGRALGRALVLHSIGLLNGWALPFFAQPFVALVAGAIIFGGGSALLWGLIFNRTTRQGVHDLRFGTYVVSVPISLGLTMPTTPRVHRLVAAGLVVLALLVGGVNYMFQRDPSTLGLLAEGEWENLQNLQQQLLARGDLFSVGVQRMTNWSMGNTQPVQTLDITVWSKVSCRSQPVVCQELINQIATLALADYDGITRLDGLRIVVTNSFDLGLAHGNFNLSVANSIDEWRRTLHLPATKTAVIEVVEHSWLPLG